MAKYLLQVGAFEVNWGRGISYLINPAEEMFYETVFVHNQINVQIRQNPLLHAQWWY